MARQVLNIDQITAADTFPALNSRELIKTVKMSTAYANRILTTSEQLVLNSLVLRVSVFLHVLHVSFDLKLVLK